MQRDIALRIDGMAAGVAASLDGLAHYMKNNLPSEEYKECISPIANAMGAMFDLLQTLYREHPDIVPEELRSPVAGHD